MSILKRLRALAGLPRLLSTSWRAVDAWQAQDWELVESLLDPVVRSDEATAIDLLMLGIACTRQGRFGQALFYFEQIDSKKLTRFEEPFYSTNYAHLLSRLGRLADAQETLRSSSRRRWSKTQHAWADELLSAESSPEAPPIPTLTRRLLN